MTPAHGTGLNPVVRRFIEEAGNSTQAFGIGRVPGQVYAYLYFSAEPRNLNDMQHALGISKGSASTVVRQLEQWGAVKKVWVKGDRKDYYVASDWFGRILKNAVLDTVGKKMTSYRAMIDEAERDISDQPGTDGEAEFIKARLAHIRRFQGKTQKVWGSPLLQKLLK